MAKSETNSKTRMKKKLDEYDFFFRISFFSSFEFVSDFDIRVSDFRAAWISAMIR